jgi:hypothetical protein
VVAVRLKKKEEKNAVFLFISLVYKEYMLTMPLLSVCLSLSLSGNERKILKDLNERERERERMIFQCSYFIVGAFHVHLRSPQYIPRISYTLIIIVNRKGQIPCATKCVAVVGFVKKCAGATNVPSWVIGDKVCRDIPILSKYLDSLQVKAPEALILTPPFKLET